MAEFDRLDEVLRDAVQRAAQPGDPAGVADAIRARVAAGDPGASATGATAPGWSSGVASWLPWLGLVVGAGVLGGGLGVAGVFAPTDEAVASPYNVVQVTTSGYQCPGGPAVTELGANERVLAVARDDESAWLQVRDPRDLTTLVWLPTRVVAVDAGQDVAALPVGEGCPEEVGYAIEPELEPEVPEQPQQPGGPPAPPPPGDTTPPYITGPSASESFVYPNPGFNSSTISVYATDDTAVTSVSISWSGAHSGSSSMTQVGGSSQWVYTYVRPGDAPNGVVTFLMRAYDAAGNASGTVSVNVTLSTLD